MWLVIVHTLRAATEVTDVWPVIYIQGQRGVPPHPVSAVVHRLDLPGGAVIVGILQVEVGVVGVTDVRPAGSIQRQRGAAAYGPSRVHCPELPGEAILVGVPEVTVGGVIVADVWPASPVQGQRGIHAHIPACIHRLGEPGRAVVVGVLEAIVGIVVVADAWPAG